MTAACARCGGERLQGNIEARGDSLRIRVYAGPDPVTAKPVYLPETVRGTDDATSPRSHGCQAEKACRPSSVVSLDHVIDGWLRVPSTRTAPARPTWAALLRRPAGLVADQ